MAGLARGDHGVGRAARALGARAGRVEPEAQRDADRVRSGAEERDGAVDAAAHRDRDPARRRGRAVKTGAIAFASASAASVSPGTAAASSSERPTSGRSRPGASASTMRSSVDGQPHGGVVLAARGVSDQLERRHPRRLAACLPRATARPAVASRVDRGDTEPSLRQGHGLDRAARRPVGADRVARSATPLRPLGAVRVAPLRGARGEGHRRDPVRERRLGDRGPAGGSVDRSRLLPRTRTSTRRSSSASTSRTPSSARTSSTSFTTASTFSR